MRCSTFHLLGLPAMKLLYSLSLHFPTRMTCLHADKLWLPVFNACSMFFMQDYTGCWPLWKCKHNVREKVPALYQKMGDHFWQAKDWLSDPALQHSHGLITVQHASYHTDFEPTAQLDLHGMIGRYIYLGYAAQIDQAREAERQRMAAAVTQEQLQVQLPPPPASNQQDLGAASTRGRPAHPSPSPYAGPIYNPAVPFRSDPEVLGEIGKLQGISDFHHRLLRIMDIAKLVFNPDRGTGPKGAVASVAIFLAAECVSLLVSVNAWS